MWHALAAQQRLSQPLLGLPPLNGEGTGVGCATCYKLNKSTV